MSSSCEPRSMSAIARAGCPFLGQRASQRPPGATIPDGTVARYRAGMLFGHLPLTPTLAENVVRVVSRRRGHPAGARTARGGARRLTPTAPRLPAPRRA
jgi:hypothetical protein